MNFLCAFAVGYTRRLHDRFIRAHIIYNTHKSVIKRFERFAEHFIKRFNDRAF